MISRVMAIAVFVCAVMSGVNPADLESEKDVIEQVRRLSSNSTDDDDGLNTGSIVAIIAGGVAALILISGLVWWMACRSPTAHNMSRKTVESSRGFVPRERNESSRIPPDFFQGAFRQGIGSTEEHTSEIPLLRLECSRHGAV